MVVRQRQRQHQPRHECVILVHRLDDGLGHAEDRQFRRVDDRRERRAADAAQAGNREAAALHFGCGDLLLAGARADLAEFPGNLHDTLLVHIAQHRHHQSVGRINRHADVEVLLEHQILSPLASSDALNSGNCCSATTTAFTMNASGVILMFCLAYSTPSSLRKASISVMSASSNCVMCGMVTQLRCRFAPDIFLMRDSGLVSIAPNLAKSTTGIASTCRPLPPVAPRGCARAALTNSCTSSLVTRPFSPLPLTWATWTPSSRAKRRIAGLACAFPAEGALCNSGAAPRPPEGRGAGGVSFTGAPAAAGCDVWTTAGATATGAATGAVAGAGAGCTACWLFCGTPAASLLSSSKISEPCDTLSPTLTFISLITPA